MEATTFEGRERFRREWEGMAKSLTRTEEEVRGVVVGPKVSLQDPAQGKKSSIIPSGTKKAGPTEQGPMREEKELESGKFGEEVYLNRKERGGLANYDGEFTTTPANES